MPHTERGVVACNVDLEPPKLGPDSECRGLAVPKIKNVSVVARQPGPAEAIRTAPLANSKRLSRPCGLYPRRRSRPAKRSATPTTASTEEPGSGIIRQSLQSPMAKLNLSVFGSLP